MPRIARIVGTGYPHHIVQRGNNRENVFLDRTDYEKYLSLLAKYSKEEFRQRTEELNQTNSFLRSILSSLHSGVAVLDSRQNVVSRNSRAEDLWGLRTKEVQGSSLMNLDRYWIACREVQRSYPPLFDRRIEI